MNIAYIFQKNDPYIEGRIKYLERKGHRIYKLTYGKSQSYSTQCGVINFNLSDQYPFLPLIVKRLVHFIEISRFCRNYNIDILHIGNMLSAFYLISTGPQIKIIENEGSDVLKTPQEYFLLKSIYRIFYRLADAILQDSIITKNAGLSLGAPSSNNEIIRFGVDFNKYNPNIIKNICRNAIDSLNNEIIFCSRGHKDLYNLDIILKSIPIVCEEFPNVRFVFACLKKGFNDKYDELIKRLNIEDKVITVNHLDHRESMPYYCRDANIVVSVPSSDSSPASVYESMACKTPVIISDIPWYREVFIQDRDVAVVPVRNVGKLASTMIKVLNGDKKIDVESAYEKVFNHLNYETENAKLEKFYQNILGIS